MLSISGACTSQRADASDASAWERLRRAVVAIVSVAAMFAALPVRANAVPLDAGAAADVVSLRVAAPAHASSGEIVPVEVWADGARRVAAYEVVATINPVAGRIEVVAADEGAVGVGAREDLSVGDLTGYGVLAAYSPRKAGAGSASTHLGTFMVRMLKSGDVDLRLGAVALFDPAGAALPVAGDRSVSVSVTSASGSVEREAGRERWPAPPMPWLLRDQSGAPARRPVPAIELQLDWQATRLAPRRPCSGAAAAKAGGCVDVGDIQRLAATTTPLAAPAAAVPASANVVQVNDRADAVDKSIGNGICATSSNTCTLRAAIQEANALPGANTITFALSGSAPFIIRTNSRLPALSDRTGGTTIDGYSQPGAARNTDPATSNATVLVQVIGVGSNGHDGFAITSGSNVIDGLSIYRFRRPIWIFRTGRTASGGFVDEPGNVITGSVIGTDPTGTYIAPALVDLGHGIHIEQDSPNTIIGGTAPGDRNVISGNARHGVGVWHSRSDRTIIRGNIVGLSPMGDRRVPNLKHGLDLNFGASESIVGGTGPGERNVVSGNGDNGIEISHTMRTTNNLVAGNYIGTDVTGDVASWSGNADQGVWIEDAASVNIIEHNVFGGNVKGALRIINGGTNGISTGNVVRDNWIGISPRGADIRNGQAGVLVEGSNNVIGPNNRIVGQAGPGIVSTTAQAQQNSFTRNLIHGNGGLSIDLTPRGKVNLNDPGDADTGPNTLLNHPVITRATSLAVSGTTCAGCTVELFTTGRMGSSGAGNGPAMAYVGATVASPTGDFLLAISGVPVDSWVSSTATDPAGNTSEMSANAKII